MQTLKNTTKWESLLAWSNIVKSNINTTKDKLLDQASIGIPWLKCDNPFSQIPASLSQKIKLTINKLIHKWMKINK